jgi:hypothetical protein
VVSFTTLPLYPRRKSPRHQLDRRLGGSQSRSGRHEVKILAHTGTRTWSSGPWAVAIPTELSRLFIFTSLVAYSFVNELYDNVWVVCVSFRPNFRKPVRVVPDQSSETATLVTGSAEPAGTAVMIQACIWSFLGLGIRTITFQMMMHCLEIQHDRLSRKPSTFPIFSLHSTLQYSLLNWTPDSVIYLALSHYSLARGGGGVASTCCQFAITQ